jgi:hypothetical protein
MATTDDGDGDDDGDDDDRGARSSPFVGRRVCYDEAAMGLTY